MHIKQHIEFFSISTHKTGNEFSSSEDAWARIYRSIEGNCSYSTLMALALQILRWLYRCIVYFRTIVAEELHLQRRSFSGFFPSINQFQELSFIDPRRGLQNHKWFQFSSFFNHTINNFHIFWQPEFQVLQLFGSASNSSREFPFTTGSRFLPKLQCSNKNRQPSSSIFQSWINRNEKDDTLFSRRHMYRKILRSNWMKIKWKSNEKC